MADETARELVKRKDKAFEGKINLDALNQEIALNFYPARADFTAMRPVGEEFAADLFDSEPLRCRRDLADARSAMLRPDGQEWFKAQMTDERLNDDPAVNRALDQLNKEFRDFISDPRNGYGRTEKEADDDIVSFGWAVKSAEVEIDKTGIKQPVMRCWHTRDFAYFDDITGTKPDVAFRKFDLAARHIRTKFPKADLAPTIMRALENEPDKEFPLCHAMMRVQEYDWHKKPGRLKDRPWASVYFDCEHHRILREDAEPRFKYLVDGWRKWPGSQYFYSPAALTALPDARGLQAMAMVLLEASEKSLDPPLQAIKGVIKSAIDQRAGAIVFTDKNYDGRQPAIQPLLPQDRQIPIGVDMIVRATLALRDDWYLANLHLPQQEKTAYETQVLFEQWIRANLPLFGPWQDGINMMLEEAWYVMWEIKARYFRERYNWPAELFSNKEDNIIFKFKNPLRDATERNLINIANQLIPVVVGGSQIDSAALKIPNMPQIIRDVANGIGAPADWVNDEKQVQQAIAAEQQAKQYLAALQTAGQVADVAKTGTEAAANLQQAAQASPTASGQFPYGPS